MCKNIKRLIIFCLIVFAINKAVNIDTNILSIEANSSNYSTFAKDVINRMEGYALATENDMLFNITSTITRDQKSISKEVIHGVDKKNDFCLYGNTFNNLLDDFNELVSIKY